MSYAEHFARTIFTNLQAADKKGITKELLKAMANENVIPAKDVDALARAVISREKLGTTGIGKGIAIPHAKTDAVEKLVAGLGTSKEGVDFDALDGDPVYTIFLILAPSGEASDYLNLLRWISSLARNRDFCRFIRQAATPEEILGLLREMGDS